MPPANPFYGTPGKGKNEIRIAYVLKQADLERAMDLLALGIKAYNEKKYHSLPKHNAPVICDHRAFFHFSKKR